MVSANVKIIEELTFFLKTVSEDAGIRALVTQDKSDFSRHRKLTLERVVGIIINMPKRSLSIEIQDFFDSLGKGSESPTKGAFSLQRGKLQPLFFNVWNKWLVDHFYHYYGDHIKRWEGFRLQAVDGSCIYLFNRKEVMDYFGSHTNQHASMSMARVLQIHDVLNDITVWGAIYPIKESEKAIMAGQIRHLAVDSLTLFDRGFPSYGLMYLMINEETPRHFVMRCPTTFNKEVTKFSGSSKRSKIVTFYPSDKAIAMLKENGYKIRAGTPLKIRMVQVNLPNGEQEILLTNLYDEKRYTVADLKYLYGLRWGIETVYNKQKNQLQLEQFSGIRVICIQQDYAASILVANLQSLIQKQSIDYLKRIHKRRKYNYQINRNISFASLKYEIVQLLLTVGPTKILRRLQKKFERYLEPVRPGRQYPRSKKKARRAYGKYQTFTNYKRAI